eukprot:Hpha_TRINITY_DN14804_c0_g8::TRINITY_DN14804_c0_g8_i1::g.169386::m.169386
MSSCALGSDAEVARLAVIVQKDVALVNGDVFLEGHPCRTDAFGDTVLLVYKAAFVVVTPERAKVHFSCPISEVRVVPSLRDTLLLEVPLPLDTLRCEGLTRADEVGRLLWFLRAQQLGTLDDRLQEAMDRLEPDNVYARTLARYPQHHHDLWRVFGIHTVLHPPEREVPALGLPGGVGYEYDTDLDAVIGFHTATELQIRSVLVGPEPADFKEQQAGTLVEQLRIYITMNSLCVAGSNLAPLPLTLHWRGVLTVNEWTLQSEDDASEEVFRVVHMGEGDEQPVSYVFAGFQSPEALDRAVREATLAWAHYINRNYNVGDACPALDDADLMNIVNHYREMDYPGYGLMPRDAIIDELGAVDSDEALLDLIFGGFDLRADERVQFAEFFTVMRTLVAGPVEDKADLVFRYFDGNQQGWLDLRDFALALSVMTASFDPVIRTGYTLADFARWLFAKLDSNSDQYITRNEFVEGIVNDPEVRNAFTSLCLAPCKRLETRHTRQKGDRFVAWGHPHWKLCCAIMAGFDTTMTGSANLAPAQPGDNQFTESVSYDIRTGDVWIDPEAEGNPWAEPPAWARGFPPGCRVEVVRLQNKKQFNGARGTVTGIDPDRMALRVELDGQPSNHMLRVQNLVNRSVAVRRTYHLMPEDKDLGIGMRIGRRESGSPFVLEVIEDSAAEYAEVPYGALIEYADGSIVHSVNEVEEAVAEWSMSPRAVLLLGLIVYVDEDEVFDDFEEGARVEIDDPSQEEYHQRQGTILGDEEGEEATGLPVLLDGDEQPVWLPERVMLPLVDAQARNFILEVPLLQPLGLDYERREDGPLYVASLAPGSPALLSGLPLQAIIHEVDGEPIDDEVHFKEALEQWRDRNETELMIGALVVAPRVANDFDFDPAAEAKGWVPQDEGSKIIVTEYAPRVFAELRAHAGLADDDFTHSLGLQQLKAGVLTGTLRSLIESRPGQLWFTSHDRTLVVKGLRESEADRLVFMLQDYRQHMLNNPNSLMLRYFGLYSLQWEDADIYYAVIANAFAVPHKELSGVYSMRPGKSLKQEKGGWGKRRVSLAPSARSLLIHQVSEDALFLAEKGAAGYAFLIGIHSVDAEVEGGPLKTSEHVMPKTAQMFLGNRAWSRDKLIHRLTGGQRTLGGPFPTDHFTLTPAEEEAQERGVADDAGGSTLDNSISPYRPAPVEKVKKKPEGPGWECLRCGTINSHARTEQRVRPTKQPACAGCYASRDAATLPIHEATASRHLPRAAAEVTEESDESIGESEDAFAVLEGVENPFADALSPPISSPLITGRPGVQFDPSQERGQLRTIFQRFYGGTPGVLYGDDEHPDVAGAEQTEIFHFAVIDILGAFKGAAPRPPIKGLPVGLSEQKESEWYFNEFVDAVEAG